MSHTIDLDAAEDGFRPASPSHNEDVRARAPPAAATASVSLLEATMMGDGGEEEEYIRVRSMQGCQFDWSHEMRYWLLALCTGGLSCLLGFWFPAVMRRHRYRQVACLAAAEYVAIESMDAACDFVPVERISTHPLAYVPRMMGHLWNGPRHINDQLAHPATYIEPSERMLVWRHHRFFLNVGERAPPSFVKQHEPLQETSEVLRSRLVSGLSTAEHALRQRLFGINQLQIIVPSYPALLMREFFHPFFVFQIYSVILWCFEEYYIFALCIAVIASVSIVTTLLETHSRLSNLSRLARFEAELNVVRHDSSGSAARLKQSSSVQLVPGDIIEVETGLIPCDLTILSGGAVVNESMLTGESIPVIKTNLQLPLDPNALVPLGIEPRSTLYAATKLLQLKPSVPGGKVYGMVVRTGFATTKGALILSILYPKPSSFKFVQQSYKFIGALFVMSLFGFAISIWQLYEHAAAVRTMIIRGLDLITIVVPPSLPLALSVGVNFAMVALKAHRIFCISPAHINLAGKVQLMCFDKTGTLTSEGMELMGVLPATNGTFAPFHATHSETDDLIDASPRATTEEEILGGVLVRGGKLLGWGAANGTESQMVRLNDIEPELSSPSNAAPAELSEAVRSCMACCHTIAVLDGELIGDPLEIEIFKATNANVRDTARDGFVSFISCPGASINEPTTEFGVRLQFEFVPALQRMSVVVMNLGDSNDVRALAKGSPEVMRGLCRPETIPRDYDRLLRQYAHKGFRIIAIGAKHLPHGIPVMEKEALRELAESDLTFLGLVVLENKIKPETTPTLKILAPCIRSVMVTGDNPLTGCSVAKDCGLVEQGTRLFLGTLTSDESTGRPRLEWVDTDEADDGSALKLNPRTLTFDGARELGHQHFKYELALTGPVYKYLEERHLAEAATDGGSQDYVWHTNNRAGADEVSATRYFHRVILNCLVFSRMAPDQKASLVSHFQSLGIYTGMCGDGANDSSAQKAAHVGVSLSDSEASIAAPFTYQRPSISCIPVLLSEGRSALMTSFQLFKYMAMYSMIQFTAVIMLYFRGSVLGNWEYLYQDMFVVFPLTIALGGTRSTPVLSRKRPSGNLLSVANVTNVLGNMLICLAFQVMDFVAYQDAPEFDNGPATYEATSVYYFSNFQFIAMAILFARGAPWKASILTNLKFTLWSVLTIGVSLALLFSTHQGSFFRSEEVPIATHWRGLMCLFMLINVTCSVLFNVLVFPAALAWYKRWNKLRWPKVTVHGRLKNAEGPQAKLWHKLRGEFEMGWEG